MGATAEEVAQLQTQVHRLREQLHEEQLLRRQAEEAVEAVATDRIRLQRARDELAAALLAAERRAQESEEEASTLAQQLQAAAAGAAYGAAGEGASPARQQQQQERELQQEPAQLLSPGTAARVAEEAADAEVLLAALDQERRRSEELTRTLEAAEHEAVSATERLLKAQAKIEALKAKAKGRKPPAGASLAAVAADVAAEEEEAMEALQQRIAALKASRDKLIGAFDAQAAEVERLSTDNAALAESLAQLRDAASKWEAQAQGSLAQNERLKDLLEESATWTIPAGTSSTAEASANGGGSKVATAAVEAAEALAAVAGRGSGDDVEVSGAAAGVSSDGSSLAALCQRFERELLLEKARSAQLDVQVRALCMELTRAAQRSGQMQSALLPMLGGIEARLVQVLGVRPRAAALQPATAAQP